MTCQFFGPEIAILSVLSIFKYNSGKINNKFITSEPTSSRGKQRITVYGLVTRYGPQSVAQRSKWLVSNSKRYFSPLRI